MAAGKIYLVAAGPGDQRLLTLRAVELLQTCDVVLYDALANPTILSWVPPASQVISVGKHGRGKVWSQSEIHNELLKHARAGRRVVRLKGGDTSIFARTGEEIEFLNAHQLSFEVVPGVTAASAASAYAGIPLTHRDWSSAVAFVTGHQQAIDGEDEAEDELDWAALARFPGTLVLYMAVTNTGKWSKALIDAGKPGKTPVAIVRHASLPQQRTIATTLDQVAAIIDGPPKMRPPIVFIIGQVAQLQSTMDWYTRLPLFGKSILLARPAGQNEELANKLTQFGANVLIDPALQIDAPKLDSDDGRKLDEAILNIHDYQWIVFSSAQGVHHWLSAFLAKHNDIRKLGDVKLAGVGPSVQRVLFDYHLTCDICLEEDFNADHLAQVLAASVHNQKILIVSTNQANGELAEKLSKVAEVHVVIAYVSQPRASLSQQVFDQIQSIDKLYVLATSSAIARSLTAMLKDTHMEKHWLSLSPKISDCLAKLGATNITQVHDLEAVTIAEAMQL